MENAKNLKRYNLASVVERNSQAHLKTRPREKRYKCNQCDYASIQESDLRRHLLTHSGEKNHKCDQCDFASARAGNLRTHLKSTLETYLTSPTNVTLHLLRQAI